MFEFLEKKKTNDLSGEIKKLNDRNQQEQVSGKNSQPSSSRRFNVRNTGNKAFCNKCGTSHENVETSCIAYGKTCGYCKGENHFIAFCLKLKKPNNEVKKANIVDEKFSSTTSLNSERPPGNNRRHPHVPDRNTSRPSRGISNIQNNNTSNEMRCYKCGSSDKRYEHENDETLCAAYGKVCGFCGGENHFKAFCMKTRKAKNEEKKLNISNDNDSDAIACVSDNLSMPGENRKFRQYQNCMSCGTFDKHIEHRLDKTQCPAFGSRCSYCREMNHFQKQCKKFNEEMQELKEYKAKKAENDAKSELENQLVDHNAEIENIRQRLDNLLK